MSNKRILLADDSITIQKVVNLTFADEGIEVVTVGDGDAAMQKFVEITPDLVMVDVNMPGLDGYRICEMIKQDAETKEIPVILLVGSFEPFDENEARRVGANDFLTKPFQSIRQLVNKVSDLLNAGNGAATVNGFSDTLEMQPIETEKFNETVNAGETLGDAGMDDEMIQTNQINAAPFDETSKFSSASNVEAFPQEKDFDGLNDTEPMNFEAEIKDDEAANQKSPQNFNAPSIADLTKAKTERLDENYLAKFNEDALLTNESNDNRQAAPDDFQSAESFPAFDFDEFDLLDIVQQTQQEKAAQTADTADEFDASEVAPEVSIGDSTPDQANEVIVGSLIDDAPEKADEYPPEVIEAIARRVVESLSDKIVREVVRQLADEKLK